MPSSTRADITPIAVSARTRALNCWRLRTVSATWSKISATLPPIRRCTSVVSTTSSKLSDVSRLRHVVQRLLDRHTQPHLALRTPELAVRRLAGLLDQRVQRLGERAAGAKGAGPDAQQLRQLGLERGRAAPGAEAQHHRRAAHRTASSGSANSGPAVTSPKAAGNSALAAMMVTIWPVGTVLPARWPSVSSRRQNARLPEPLSPAPRTCRSGPARAPSAASFDSSEEYGDSRAVSACGRRSAALMTTVASIMMAANPSTATIQAPYSLQQRERRSGHAGRQRHLAGGPPCRLIVSVRELEWRQRHVDGVGRRTAGLRQPGRDRLERGDLRRRHVDAVRRRRHLPQRRGGVRPGGGEADRVHLDAVARERGREVVERRRRRGVVAVREHHDHPPRPVRLAGQPSGVADAVVERCAVVRCQVDSAACTRRRRSRSAASRCGPSRRTRPGRPCRSSRPRPAAADRPRSRPPAAARPCCWTCRRRTRGAASVAGRPVAAASPAPPCRPASACTSSAA